MKTPLCVVTLTLAALALASQVAACPLSSTHLQARHKPGPVTVRGVATHVNAHQFTLQTSSHGTYGVTMVPATEIREKGKSGHLTVHEGDHVGVRGFVTGRAIQAIRVTIYPTKSKGPKPFSVRGTVSGVQGSDVTLAVGGKTVKVHVTGGTAIVVGSAPGSLHDIRVRDRVEARVQGSGTALTALHIHVYRQQGAGKHIEVRGTLSAASGQTLTVTSGSSRYTIAVSSQTQVYTGTSPTTLRALKPGETVTVHACCAGAPLTALSIHVARTPPGHHVQLRGVVGAVTSGSVTLTAGSQHYQITIGSGTRVYSGTTTVSPGTLRPGQTITVHVCCAGRSLTATSIHIQRVSVKRTTLELRGRVLAMTSGQIRISASGGGVTVDLQSSTVYEVGASPTSRGGVRVGNQVSIRAYRDGSALRADRVHVYAQYRRLRTIDGVVTAVTRSGIVIDARGKRYSIAVSSRTPISLNGKPASLSLVRVGDRVRAVGTVDTVNNLTPAQVIIRRLPPRKQTVSGTLLQAGSGAFVIVDGFGQRHQVRPAPGVQVDLQGRPAPASALFPGVKVTARGTMSGGMLIASAITVTVQTRSVKGRVTAVTRSGIAVRSASGQTISVDIPPALSVADGTARRGRKAPQVGAYVEVRGYVEPSGAVRAASVQILHPTVTVTASVVSASGDVIVQAPNGDRFKLHFSPTSSVSMERTGMALSPRDIPNGARVRVQGTLESDGSLAVVEVVVRLPSVTLRGRVSAIQGTLLTVDAGTGPLQIRTSGETAFVQGTHVLTLADVVPGDDVTVYGYRAGGQTVLARKVDVHRKLTGFDGTVGAVTGDGFTLMSTGSVHRVIVNAATIFSGGAADEVAAGLGVHVTGYLRGDGVILATRVRLSKKRSNPVVDSAASSPRTAALTPGHANQRSTGRERGGVATSSM